ncbi:ATP-dependent zinc metalloprotease FtsH [bacterium]|nr:ATP-dependent zinc metalloprotease FtsH [candidate division CSSED10-310 bacterium]
MNNRFRTLIVWSLLILLLFAVYQMFVAGTGGTIEIEYSRFLDQVQAGNVQSVTMIGKKIEGKFLESHTDTLKFTVIAPPHDGLIDILRQHNVKISVKDDSGGILESVLISWLPFLLLIGIWIFFIRQMQGGGRQALTFGKSRAKLMSDDRKKITFQDVAGIDEAKEELEEIIDFLKDPQRFSRLGGKIPKGVLLVGPPGTGKTLLARAIAGEADVPFFSISGSDFVEMFVGVGASRVRDLFETGKKNAPCLIFMDEIDAVGRHRGAGLGGGHDEREQTLNQLLVEMDGFESNEGVILIAATNRPDVLDPALLRPGRFDRQVVVDRPDIRGREGILKVHLRHIKTCDNVDIATLAKGTPGFSGADLANLVNEAALLAARSRKDCVENNDFELAKDKVMMGVERRSMIISEKEKRNTAFHEAGHALVARLTPGSDPVHKVTIIPRGRALGVTMHLPEEDRFTHSERQLRNQIVILMGGRAAEDVMLDSYTTGAANDIARATEIAKKMVTVFGMSRILGPVSYEKESDHVFLGREFVSQAGHSEETARLIDAEIKRTVNECYETARDLLKTNADRLNALAEALLDYEVLDAAQIDEIIGFATNKSETPQEDLDESMDVETDQSGE